MKKIGQIVTAVGGVILLIAFLYDTAPDYTHNIGLLQKQMMIFGLGGLALLAGILLFAVGEVVDRLEKAGFLPPADYEPTLKPSETANSDVQEA